MSVTDRRILILIVIVAVLGLVPVAAFVGSALSESAYQLDSQGTDWTISQLGNDPAPAGPYALSFGQDGDHATVVLACGAVPLWWVVGHRRQRAQRGCHGPGAIAVPDARRL